MQHHKKVPQARLSQGLQPQKPPPQKNAPLSAAVESDVVGYTTITMEAGKWYLLGCPFTPLNGETTTQINETFAGEGFASGDVLYTLTEAGTYKPYYWHQDESNSGWSTHKVLWREDTTEYPITDAVYIRKTVNGEITFSGSVAAMKVDIGTTEGNAWDLVSLMYPGTKLLNEYNWESFQSGDCLYTLSDKGTFTPHYWHDDGTNIGWSTHKVLWRAPTQELVSGQAVYVLKNSQGKGSVSTTL